MSLPLLYADELAGFSRSRAMLVLWVGMPVVALAIHALQPNLQGQMSLTVFSTLIVSSISSTISAVMLSVGIIHEKSRGVYALFLVRPVKRRNILLAKFFAVLTCILVAAAITLAVGMAYDWLRGGMPDLAVLVEVGRSAVTAIASIGIASAAGILIGILSPSVIVGAILVIYGANQLSVLGFLPILLGLEPAWLYSLAIGVPLSVLLLTVSVALFNRKQF
ncbi:MAG: ABC transporter permease [Acidobacteria bacterium]|nr:ABC transporter permease [Acidobacteriota bacterium]